MLNYKEPLTEQQIQIAQQQSQAKWGEGRSLQARLEKLHRQLAYNNGEILTYVGLLQENNTVVSSCKKYTIYTSYNGHIHKTFGIGAVYTDDTLRQSGYASQLLKTTLARAREQGYTAALLFSDISPAYYAKFGFSELPARDLKIPTQQADNKSKMTLRMIETTDISPLMTIFKKHTSELTLTSVRDSIRWHFFRERAGAIKDFLFFNGDQIVGYFTVTSEDSNFYLLEIFVDSPFEEMAWQTLTDFAWQKGHPFLEAWEPAKYPSHLKQYLVQRKEAIPMFRCLEQDLTINIDTKAWLGGLDNF